MRKSARLRGLVFLLALGGLLVVGCSRDPNARKRAYFESGTQYYKQGKYREAAVQLQNALQIDPRYAEAHYELSQCYARLGIGVGTYRELLRTIDLQPDNIKAQLALGNLMLGGREFMRAQSQAKLVLSKNPKSVEAHILLANALASLQNPQDSIEEMQKALQLDPERPLSYLNLGMLQLNAKQVKAAEESFKKAVALDPKSTQALLALGNFYQAQRRWSEAEQSVRHAIELEPKNAQMRAGLVRFYLAQQKRDLAEQAAREGSKALADDPGSYALLAEYYFMIGDMSRALAEYASLHQSHPTDVKLTNSYVQILILQNRLDEAARLTDGVLKENPKESSALVNRAQILTRQKRPSDAIPILTGVLKNEPDNALAHFQ